MFFIFFFHYSNNTIQFLIQIGFSMHTLSFVANSPFKNYKNHLSALSHHFPVRKVEKSWFPGPPYLKKCFNIFNHNFILEKSIE